MKIILIVDDDPFIAEIYQAKFQAAGFAVDVAASGRRALVLLGERVPDVMLLDLSLGDMTGVKLLEIIRANPAMRAMPVVVLSNAYMGNLLQAARRAGASRCLNKGLCAPDRVVEEVCLALGAEAAPARPVPVYRPASVLVAPSEPPEPSALRLAPQPERGTLDEERLQGQLRGRLLEIIHTRMSEARRTVQQWQAAPEQFSIILPQFRRTIHVLADSATLAGLTRLSQLASALEALLLEVELDSPKVSVSALRTTMQATELMAEILRPPVAGPAGLIDQPSILVVDDDPISRAAICHSLETAQLRAISVGDPRQAVALFAENAFDLVFLDVDMPGMDGFAVCDRLHASESNAATPVVFVTAMKDFETCLRSSRTGAVDFINKPLVLAEFALKALIHLDRGRLLAAV